MFESFLELPLSFRILGYQVNLGLVLWFSTDFAHAGMIGRTCKTVSKLWFKLNFLKLDSIPKSNILLTLFLNGGSL